MPDTNNLPRARPPSQKAHKFAQRFIETGNGTQAAIDAGYAKGNRRSAARRASRLLKNVFIQRMIAEENRKALLRAGATKEETIRDLRCIAFADIGDAFNADGKLKPFSEMPEAMRRAIASVEVEQVGTVCKVRLSDKVSALDKLAKILALYPPDRLAIEGGVTLDQLVPKRRPRDTTEDQDGN